jgi:SAM-dependent methyltransferase
VGLYARYVLPRLIDLAMGDAQLAKIRSEVVPRACGVTLELGVGSGRNLAFYGPQVEKLYCVDPSLELQRVARTRLPASLAGAEFLAQSATDPIPLPEASIDTALVTWSLCSIPDPLGALIQVRRLLRPGGSLLFVEHGRSPDAGVARWQDRLNPLWGRLAGGCNINRPIESLVREAGFAISELERSYLEGPRVLTYTYRGVARV